MANFDGVKLLAKMRSVEDRLNERLCWSCEHRIGFHQPDGCWYTVVEGRMDSILNCPCSVSRELVESATNRALAEVRGKETA